MPKRETIGEPVDVEDIAGIIVYYEALVEKWEVWGEAVLAITGGKAYNAAGVTSGKDSGA